MEVIYCINSLTFCIKNNKYVYLIKFGINAMLAVVKTGGKQYKAEIGKQILVEKVEGELGSSIILDEVLLVSDEKKGITVGEPSIKSASVKATIVEHFKTDKVIVFKKKRRQNYRRKKGHRQEMSKLEIVEIKN